MEKLNMFQLIKLGYAIVQWYQKASEDGKITKQEILELINQVLEPDMFNIDIKL
tara:strand:+ start:1366 stop:1527 length:162 start_codon:yes stop_codon:yes gene_type:complete